jgi:hypothetical protein
MNSSGPWWAIPAFTLGGVLLTLLVTVWLDRRKGVREIEARLVEHDRESAFRWTERKLDLYSRHLTRCHALTEIAVWPGRHGETPADPAAAADAILHSAIELLYLAPQPVSAPANRTVAAAKALANKITEIRENSRPGHLGSIDAGFRDANDAARNTFAVAVAEFTATTRQDIDIDRP